MTWKLVKPDRNEEIFPIIGIESNWSRKYPLETFEDNCPCLETEGGKVREEKWLSYLGVIAARMLDHFSILSKQLHGAIRKLGWQAPSLLLFLWKKKKAANCQVQFFLESIEPLFVNWALSMRSFSPIKFLWSRLKRGDNDKNMSRIEKKVKNEMSESNFFDTIDDINEREKLKINKIPI